jgi:hypothetical protein
VVIDRNARARARKNVCGDEAGGSGADDGAKGGDDGSSPAPNASSELADRPFTPSKSQIESLKSL